MNEKRDLGWVPLFLGLILTVVFLAGFFILYLHLTYLIYGDPEGR